MQAVAQLIRVSETLYAVNAIRVPFIQEIVGVVATEFHPWETVIVSKGEILFHRLRTRIKAEFHLRPPLID
jgi:hypothetical protein